MQVVQEMNRSSELVCSYLPLILIIIDGFFFNLNKNLYTCLIFAIISFNLWSGNIEDVNKLTHGKNKNICF